MACGCWGAIFCRHSPSPLSWLLGVASLLRSKEEVSCTFQKWFQTPTVLLPQSLEGVGGVAAAQEVVLVVTVVPPWGDQA